MNFLRTSHNILLACSLLLTTAAMAANQAPLCPSAAAVKHLQIIPEQTHMIYPGHFISVTEKDANGAQAAIVAVTAINAHNATEKAQKILNGITHNTNKNHRAVHTTGNTLTQGHGMPSGYYCEYAPYPPQFITITPGYRPNGPIVGVAIPDQN